MYLKGQLQKKKKENRIKICPTHKLLHFKRQKILVYIVYTSCTPLLLVEQGCPSGPTAHLHRWTVSSLWVVYRVEHRKTSLMSFHWRNRMELFLSHLMLPCGVEAICSWFWIANPVGSDGPTCPDLWLKQVTEKHWTCPVRKYQSNIRQLVFICVRHQTHFLFQIIVCSMEFVEKKKASMLYMMMWK